MLKIRSVNFEHNDFQIHTLEQCYPGQLEWVIGRNITSDLLLNNPEVSRTHAKIFYKNDAYYFSDLSSTCGSILNGDKLAPDEEPHLLHPGDLLQLGDIFLHIEELSPPFLPPAKAESAPRLIVLPEGQHWTHEDLTVRCYRIVEETSMIKSFYFLANPPVLFNYKPGQFVNLEVQIDAKPVVRPYSISTSPTRPHCIAITVKRVMHPDDRPDLPNGLVSNWLQDHLQVGDSVRLLGGPMGQFTCLPKLHPKLLFISGGSGIAPMMSMTRWIYDAIADCDIVFLYSAPTPHDIPFRTELEIMTAHMPNFHLAVTITQQDGLNGWLGLTGRISKSMLHLVVPDLLERFVYICGSEPFMQKIKSILKSVSFPMQNCIEESFGSPILKSANPKGNLHLAKQISIGSQPSAQKPTVYFSQSKQEVITDDTASILELAEQAGVTIRNHCRVGACGACKVLTCQGKVNYSRPPSSLSEADQKAGYVLACIARPIGTLTVEA
jgi:ferredoxin-NADP reductase